MRIIYLGNNWAAWQVLKWLTEQGDDIVALVVHPAAKSKYEEQIINTAGIPKERIFDGSKIRQPRVIDAIRKLKPEIGISAFFGYILDREFLELLPGGCINVHPAFLPYNRGTHPNVWSLIENTPIGATLHG